MGLGGELLLVSLLYLVSFSLLFLLLFVAFGTTLVATHRLPPLSLPLAK
jgi:hypothetical protein